MSEQNGIGSREWVKTVAIIFLVVMLILTFFSNTIMNYSLPEVKTATVYSGSITAKVRGTGTVTAKDPYHVKATESRKVASVAVSNGDVVSEGDVLFYYDEKESDEIKAALDALDTEKEALEALEEAYKKSFLTGTSMEAYIDAAGNTIESEADLQARVEEVLKQKQTVETEIARLKGLLPALNRQLEIYNSQDADAGLQYAITQKTAKEAELSTAQASLATAEASRDAAQAILDAGTAPADELAAAQTQLDQANADIATYTAKINTLNSEISTLTSEIATIQKAVDDLASGIQNITNQISQVNYEISLQEANYTQLQAILTEIGEKYSIVEAEEDITKQKEKVAEAQAELDELIADSKGTTVTAPASGTITNIAVSAGDTTVPDTDIAVIQVDGKGYTLEFSVTKQQAKKLNVGDEAELVNNWYYSDVHLTLSKIKTDPQNPSKNSILVFDIVGSELMGGENLTVSIGQRSANYDLIVPNSAIHEDNDGKFILTVETKQSTLGNRYIATRENIEVLAEDDTQSAIKAAL